MKLHLLLYCLCSLCLLTVKSQDDRPIPRVIGPDILVTDRTRNLTLTCPAESFRGGQYTWITPGKDTARCATRQSGKVCIFTPMLEDDNQNVTCTLVDPGPVFSSAFYQVNLKYPPQSSPNITIEPRRTEPLKQGDNITCTVSGGKPRVTNITFHCQDPDLADRDDDVSDDGRTVSSSITVDTSQTTKVNTTCTCEALWDPEAELYADQTTMSFQLEYRAEITHFTVNDTTELTVNEASHSTVTFTCQGQGRPPPTLRLHKQGNDTALIETTNQPLVYSINSVRGEDLATYRCEADNGFPVSNNSIVELLVNSVPRIVESYDSSNPPTLPTEGLTFTLVAYPTPAYKESNFLGNGNVTTSEPAPENTFKIQCTRSIVVKHLVNCHVTPQNVPKEKVGLYELTVTNGLGDASFRFRVESPVTPPQDDDSILTVAIVGAVVGVLLVIGIIVVIVICHRRRKRNVGRKGHHGSQNRNRNNGTTAPVTSTTPTSAAAHDSRPDSTATTTYDKINDGPSSAGSNTTAARCSTDSKGYASVGDTSLQGSNKAALTRRTNVQTLGYEDVELDPMGAPTVMTTPEKPDVVAPMPEDSAERITGPKGDVYAVVGPKQKGDNQPVT